MPIVFPRGAVQVVEKIVEKVVEKVRYVAISLVKSFEVKDKPISKPSIPEAVVTATTSLKLAVLAWAPFVRYYFKALKLSLVSKPAIPSATRIASFSIGSFWSCLRAFKTRSLTGFFIITKPQRPTPQSFFEVSARYVYGVCMEAKKMYPTFKLVSKPQAPSRETVSTEALSVGVRVRT